MSELERLTPGEAFRRIGKDPVYIELGQLIEMLGNDLDEWRRELASGRLIGCLNPRPRLGDLTISGPGIEQRAGVMIEASHLVEWMGSDSVLGQRLLAKMKRDNDAHNARVTPSSSDTDVSDRTKDGS